ncbi:MAG: hypothetical protein IH933_10245 [Euryarchaeota archaeon]|nr:hypothetical protein [Euryarchaeota archaeon]
MDEAGYPKDADAIAAERDRTVSTRDRVYETAIQLYEPATADAVADRARCSEGAAREHLEWFSARDRRANRRTPKAIPAKRGVLRVEPRQRTPTGVYR